MTLDPYIGIPYSEDFDCADFVAMVRRDLFRHEVRLPNGRERGERGQLVLAARIPAYGVPTDTPSDGDLVLMGRVGRKGAHVGLYFYRDFEGCVLHSNETDTCSVLHRIRDLPGYGVTVKGIYAWA